MNHDIIEFEMPARSLYFQTGDFGYLKKVKDATMSSEVSPVLCCKFYLCQGSLNLGIDDAPGNGLVYDSITALRWVQKYIKHFGGDPNRVTVSGI